LDEEVYPTMTLTRAHIQQISLKFKKMPRAPLAAVNTTKQEAVKLLANDIASLQRRGYTLEQITESLRGEGVDLSTPTLKSYLSRAKAAKTRRLRAPVAAPSPSPAAKALPLKEVGALTKAEALTKSGKDAFLVKDKDSY
jgi:hypothetical protein